MLLAAEMLNTSNNIAAVRLFETPEKFVIAAAKKLFLKQKTLPLQQCQTFLLSRTTGSAPAAVCFFSKNVSRRKC